MSTLTKEMSSPVMVAQVFADFRLGLPCMGTVFVSTRRHRVQMRRTAKGLEGTCQECRCRDGCGAVHDAICAVETLADAWERPPFSRVQARIEADLRSGPLAETEKSEIRPYDGLARDTCDADLVSIQVPPWAYDEQSVRRPVVDAEIAQIVWHELQHRLDRVLGVRIYAEPSYHSPVHKYYRASWELDRGITHAAFELDLLIDLDDHAQLDALAE